MFAKCVLANPCDKIGVCEEVFPLYLSVVSREPVYDGPSVGSPQDLSGLECEVPSALNQLRECVFRDRQAVIYRRVSGKSVANRIPAHSPSSS